MAEDAQKQLKEVTRQIQRLLAAQKQMDVRESRLLQREAQTENAERAIEKAREDIRIEWMRIQDAKRQLQS